MTDILVSNIKDVKDLQMFSIMYKKGELKVNKSKLARDLGTDRKTITKYLSGAKKKVPKKRMKYLDQFRDQILEVLQDEFQSFDYVEHLFNYFKREMNITCASSTFRKYIRDDKELNKHFTTSKNKTFTERFETEMGEQVQFDMKEKIKIYDKFGNKYICNIATVTLGFSRYNYRKLIIDTSTDVLLAFLAEAFEHMGGVPKEIIIDNLKQFVTTPRYKDKDAVLNVKFEEFCKNYSITPKPCMPYRPQTKGKTETQNKIVDQLHNYNGKYEDFYTVHDLLAKINAEDNEKISQATKLPRVFLFTKEKDVLSQLPRNEIRSQYHLSLKKVIVTNESLFSYKSNKYSVPKSFIGKIVDLTISNDKLHVYYNNKIVTIHEVSKNLLNIKLEHNLSYERSEISEDDTVYEVNTGILKELSEISYDNY